MTARERLVGGRYRLAEKIGHGGMGQVWSAYDQQLDRRVAVKLLRTDLALTAGGSETARTELRRRFRRECRVTAGFDHPGLVTVYDAGEDGDDLYRVMQRVPGLSLADLIAEEGPLPVAGAAAVAAQICAALAAVHAVPVVHRDLKPSNVMVRDDGRVVVLDLGIAAVLEPDATRITRTGGMIGSPPYMAPEQALSSTVDPRSDLYALGCMLHEMLSGEAPFHAPTALGVLRRHADDPPVPLRELRPEVPAELETLVLRLLAKQPRDRPADAQEVYRLLLPLLPAASSDPAAALRPYGALPDPARPYRHPFAPQPGARTAGAHAGPHLSAPYPPAVAPVSAAVPPQPVGAPDLAAVCLRVPELLDAGRLSEVIDLAAQVLPAAGAQHGEHAPLVLTLRRLYARTLLVERRYRTALPEWRLLAGVAAAERGPADAEALECRRQAAGCLEELGEGAAALAEYRALLPLYQARLERGADPGPAGAAALAADWDRACELRERIGRLLAADGDTEGARDTLLRLLLDKERGLGTHHPDVVRLRQDLDWLRRDRGPDPAPRHDPRGGSWPAVPPGSGSLPGSLPGPVPGPVPGNPYAAQPRPW
ncbi:serine/threonine-protein kinase [Streptomyces sp. NPDC092296]|uniref:serine/threonine-protein kinase n=1 Tax=Streptomyces sp. NPDC092296 TaxID=3366012 RepID=UPI003803CA5C